MVGNLLPAPVGQAVLPVEVVAKPPAHVEGKKPNVAPLAVRKDWPSMHKNIGWKLTNFFNDPKVVTLCNAIEKQDLNEIDRLIDEGADINARGKDNMTPLLWAFPTNEIVFGHVLKKGADPNVIFESSMDLSSPMGSPFSKGASVVMLTASANYDEGKFDNYLKLVLEHGGNPNIVDTERKITPIFEAIRSGLKNNVALLVTYGADIEFREYNDPNGANTPVMAAVRGAHFDIALFLLEKGADYKCKKNFNSLSHMVATWYNSFFTDPRPVGDDYRKLMKWLEDRGESVLDAKAQKERWAEELKYVSPKEYRVWLKSRHGMYQDDPTIPDFDEMMNPTSPKPVDKKVVLRNLRRTWKDKDGNLLGNELIFIAIQDGNVFLSERRGTNSMTVHIPFENLSPDDQKFIEDHR